jgi:hypothetical protein
MAEEDGKHQPPIEPMKADGEEPIFNEESDLLTF